MLKELFRRSSREEPQIPSKPHHEESEYEEGVFHVKKTFRHNGVGDSWSTVEKTVEGNVIGFGEGDFEFPSQSIYRKSKDTVGTYFIIEIPRARGTERVGFPREFSQERKDSMRGQTIRHYHSREDYSESSGCGLVTDIYKIDVLSGQLEGEFFEKKILS